MMASRKRGTGLLSTWLGLMLWLTLPLCARFAISFYSTTVSATELRNRHGATFLFDDGDRRYALATQHGGSVRWTYPGTDLKASEGHPRSVPVLMSMLSWGRWNLFVANLGLAALLALFFCRLLAHESAEHALTSVAFLGASIVTLEVFGGLLLASSLRQVGFGISSILGAPLHLADQMRIVLVGGGDLSPSEISWPLELHALRAAALIVWCVWPVVCIWQYRRSRQRWNEPGANVQ